MTWSFSAPLLSVASEFTGKYAPYQAVQVKPHPQGGVLVSATDQGKVAVVGYDPRGEASGETCLLVSSELGRACRAVKTGARELTVDGMNATVRSYSKSGGSSKAAEFLVQHSSVQFPPLGQALQSCIERWGRTPRVSETAGRYDAGLLERAIKAAITRESNAAAKEIVALKYATEDYGKEVSKVTQIEREIAAGRFKNAAPALQQQLLAQARAYDEVAAAGKRTMGVLSEQQKLAITYQRSL